MSATSGLSFAFYRTMRAQAWRQLLPSPNTAARDWLQHYARHFNTVELNNVLYRFPSERADEQWRDLAPENFLFAVKASRFLTHHKKLTDPDQPLEKLLDRVGHLGAKLGPILFQLPPRWRVNADRLAAFANCLPRNQILFLSFAILPGTATRCSKSYGKEVSISACTTGRAQRLRS